MICLARMRRDPRTKEYVARRTAEGKSKREIVRYLNRCVAREVYRLLISCEVRSSPTEPKASQPLDHRSVTWANRVEMKC